MAFFENHDSGEFPGSLVVRTQSSYCQEPRFEIWLGNSDSVSHTMWQNTHTHTHTHQKPPTKTTTFWAAEEEAWLMYQFTTDFVNLNE